MNFELLYSYFNIHIIHKYGIVKLKDKNRKRVKEFIPCVGSDT